jgi:pimeloyl-ACP methyl ester carboxylesterase
MMASIPSMAASGSDAGISESTTTANYASRSVEEYGASTHDELALASQAPPGSAVASILSGSCRSRCERLCTSGCGGRSRNRNGRDPAPLRETRLDEEPLRGLAPSARSIAELLSCNDPRPFALFGHSMGGKLAVHAASLLEDSIRRPVHLFVSASPVVRRDIFLLKLDDAAFIRAIASRFGALPAQITDDPEVWEVFARPLRADLEARETDEQPPIGSILRWL